MVVDCHSECATTSSDFPTDSSHAENTKDLVLRVVAELEGGAAPVVGADGGVGGVDTAEGAEHEEDGDVGGGGVDCYGGGGDGDSWGGVSEVVGKWTGMLNVGKGVEKMGTMG